MKLPLHKTATPLFGALTDIGLMRAQNEDSFIAKAPLFAVADGMGGHEAGEVASRIAIEVLARTAPTTPDAQALSQAVEDANRTILQAPRCGQGRPGMGTTLTAAVVVGERAVIAQVGDSRAYLLHAGALHQITRDHSLVADMVEAGQITPAEARVHPQRSVITRALGSTFYMHPDLFEVALAPGDRLMLCSDGLSGALEDAQLETILRQEADPQRCCEKLVRAALDEGGHDNITVVIADAPRHGKHARRKSKWLLAGKADDGERAEGQVAP